MNFDSTIVGKPYSRIERIVIDYTAPNTAEVSYQEQEHVKLEDGSHRPIGSENVRYFTVLPQDLALTVPLKDVQTGVDLGASMSYGQVMLGVLAVIREKQASS